MGCPDVEGREAEAEAAVDGREPELVGNASEAATIGAAGVPGRASPKDSRRGILSKSCSWVAEDADAEEDGRAFVLPGWVK